MILYAILALALQTAEVTPSANLGYRFLPGTMAVYTLEMNAEYTGLQTGRDQSVFVFERAIMEPDNEGRRRVQIILKSATASLQMKLGPSGPMTTTVEYDSQKPVLKIASSDEWRPFISSQYILYSQLVNQPVLVTLGDDNSVLAVEGIDEIVQKTMASKTEGKTRTYDRAMISGAMSGGVPGAVGAGLGSILGSLIGALSRGSDKYMKQITEIVLKKSLITRMTGYGISVGWLALPNFDPGRAVQPGETWRVTWASESAALEELDRAMADISKNVSGSSPMPRPPQRLVDVQMKSVEGNTALLMFSTVSSGESTSGITENESGEVTFDTVLGLIRSLNSRAEVSIEPGIMKGIHVKASSLLRLDQVSPPSWESPTLPLMPTPEPKTPEAAPPTEPQAPIVSMTPETPPEGVIINRIIAELGDLFDKRDSPKCSLSSIRLSDLSKGITADIQGIVKWPQNFQAGNPCPYGDDDQDRIVADGTFYKAIGDGGGFRIVGKFLVDRCLNPLDGVWDGKKEGAVHTLIDKLRMFDYDFDSDEAAPLVFKLTRNGYVYVEGKGTVTDLQTGKKYAFPNSSTQFFPTIPF